MRVIRIRALGSSRTDTRLPQSHLGMPFQHTSIRALQLPRYTVPLLATLPRTCTYFPLMRMYAATAAPAPSSQYLLLRRNCSSAGVGSTLGAAGFFWPCSVHQGKHRHSCGKRARLVPTDCSPASSYRSPLG